MMKHLQLRPFLVIFGLMAIVSAAAQNPFVQTWCTSDPAPMVHDGTMYVYTGHDEDGADFFRLFHAGHGELAGPRLTACA